MQVLDVSEIIDGYSIFYNIYKCSTVLNLKKILSNNKYEYEFLIIDEDTDSGCFFINLTPKDRIQVLVSGYYISNFFIEVGSSYLGWWNEVVTRNKGMDRFTMELKKYDIEWNFYNGFILEKELCIKVNKLLFKFDYSLRNPLFRIDFIN